MLNIQSPYIQRPILSFFFAHVPLPIMENIVSFCDFYDVMTMGQTNHKLRNQCFRIVRHLDLDFNILFKKNRIIIEIFQNKQQFVDSEELDAVHFQSLSILHSFPNLKSLKITPKNIEKDFHFISTLKKIRSLYVKYDDQNKIYNENVSILRQLVNLESLRLEGDKLSDKLSTGISFKTLFTHLSHLPLRSLSLIRFFFVGGTHIDDLVALTQLENLQFEVCWIRGKAPESLTKLKSLMLRECFWTDFVCLEKIKVSDLHDNRFLFESINSSFINPKGQNVDVGGNLIREK